VFECRRTGWDIRGEDEQSRGPRFPTCLSGDVAEELLSVDACRRVVSLV